MEEKTEAVKGEETTVGLTMNYNRATCSPLKRRRTALFLISSVN